MTKTDQYKRILIDKNPSIVQYPENGVTVEQALIGIVLQMSLEQEKIKKQMFELIQAFKILRNGGVEAQADEPTGEPTEEDLMNMAKRPNAGGGGAVNPQPIAQPAQQPAPRPTAKNGGGPVPQASGPKA